MFGPRFLYACGFIILAPVIAMTAEEPSGLKVMSWNIRYNNPNDGVNAWPRRKDWVAEIIQREEVDLLGLQEVLQDQLNDLQQRLPDFAVSGVGRDDGKMKGEYAPIFYRRDRFELLAESTFWLSKTPEVPGSKDWDAAITRIAGWVKLRDRNNDQTFYLINTHFDHRGREAREKSAELLIEKLSTTFADTPVVLMGDFNTVPNSLPHKTLTMTHDTQKSVFYDAWSISETKPIGPNSTSNGFKRIKDNRRIDYIFLTEGVSVKTHRILTDQQDGRFPSDHLPVMALVVLPESASE